MQGPENGFRQYVAQRAADLGEGLPGEQNLESLLDEILAGVREDAGADVGELDQDQAFEELAEAEAWLSLASHALDSFYSPASRRKDVAGWSSGAAGRLEKIAAALRNVIEAVARALGSVVYSVGIAFPLGASVSISWSPH